MEESSGKCHRIELDGMNNGVVSKELKELRTTNVVALEESSPVVVPSATCKSTLSPNHHFHSMNALEILQETIRILRYNSSGFMMIAALLICPVSVVVLSNVLVDQTIMKRLSIRLMLVAKSSGLPLKPLVKFPCQRLSEMILSSIFGFPLYITFLLVSKAAIVHCVDCTYIKRKFDSSKFCAIIVFKIWKRLVSTYIWVCMLIAGCLALFLVLLVAVCNICSILGSPSHVIVYAAIMVGMVFSIMFANAVIICNIAIVISVLEDASGPQALLRSGILIQGQTQVGLLIFLGSTIGMAFVEGLFEHRVKTLSYGDGSSRLWEGPLLVVMYSFVVLIDSMMSAVFYFTCRSSSIETLEEEEEEEEEEGHTLVEAAAFSAG